MATAKKKTSERKVDFQATESRPVVYANSVQIRVTPWDFCFRLGMISDVTQEAIKVQENAHIYMSPQHTKAFLKLLTEQVGKYEKQFGDIAEPKPADVSKEDIGTK